MTEIIPTIFAWIGALALWQIILIYIAGMVVCFWLEELLESDGFFTLCAFIWPLAVVFIPAVLLVVGFFTALTKLPRWIIKGYKIAHQWCLVQYYRWKYKGVN